MKAHIKLGRIFGVAVGLHYSWIIIALLVTLSLRSQFAIDHPNWDFSTTWAIAIITGLLFFVSILLHELSHAAVAKLRGIPVRAITLFALGAAWHRLRKTLPMRNLSFGWALLVQSLVC